MNDVVLAMCGGAVRTYLLELDALPEAPLVAMVPVGLNAKQSHVASAEGGNAVGAVMVQLGHRQGRPRRPAGRDPHVDEGRQGGAVVDDAGADPGDECARPGAGHPHADAADAGHRPAAVQPDHQQRPRARGPRTTGTAPSWSAPTRCRSRSTGWRSTSPARPTTASMAFGLTGCRRTVPHLQRLLDLPRRRGRRAGEGRRHLSRSTRGGPMTTASDPESSGLSVRRRGRAHHPGTARPDVLPQPRDDPRIGHGQGVRRPDPAAHLGLGCRLLGVRARRRRRRPPASPRPRTSSSARDRHPVAEDPGRGQHRQTPPVRAADLREAGQPALHVHDADL